MRVAMLVGVLMLNVVGAWYESGWSLDPSADASLSAPGGVHALDFPVPPSWP